MGLPFGFMKATNTGNLISLYILPYNFPRLFALMKMAGSFDSSKVPSAWRIQLKAYLDEIPFYYWMAVKNGLETVKMGHLWDKAMPLPPIIGDMHKLTEKHWRSARTALEAVRFEPSKVKKVVTRKRTFSIMEDGAVKESQEALGKFCF